jgi:hypothetical protein
MTVKLRSASLWLSLFLIAGCGSSPTAPTADSISLTSMVPAAGTMLNVGDRVTFTAVTSCTIVSSTGGMTALVIQDQANRTLLIEGETQPQATLVKGTTTVTLSHTLTIPERVRGTTITVALPMFVNESDATRAVVTRNYTIR